MNLPFIIRRITELGQIAIPREFRRALHIEDGDAIEIYIDKEKQQFILKKHEENT